MIALDVPVLVALGYPCPVVFAIFKCLINSFCGPARLIGLRTFADVGWRGAQRFGEMHGDRLSHSFSERPSS